MIVPELAAGAAPALDGLRAACDRAVADLMAAGADALVVLGGARRARRHRHSSGGTFAPWGVDVRVDGAAGAGGPGAGGQPSRLPLSLLIGVWLLARARAGVGVGVDGHELEAVAIDTPAAACARTGARLAADERRLALLVLGDGSACRGTGAPGYDDPRAAPYDHAVADALAAADTAALLALDEQLSEQLLVAGRAPWQVLAGAAHGGSWHGALSYHDAPYGVGYLVATWTAT